MMTATDFPGSGTRGAAAEITCHRCRTGLARWSCNYGGAALYWCPLCLQQSGVPLEFGATRRPCGCHADPGVFGHIAPGCAIRRSRA